MLDSILKSRNEEPKAVKHLTQIYNWFSEGHETKDLKKATDFARGFSEIIEKYSKIRLEKYEERRKYIIKYNHPELLPLLK